MDNRANAEQQEYWNTVAGPRAEADCRKRAAQRLTAPYRCADTSVRAQSLRPDHIAIWRDVLRGSGCGLHQFVASGAARRPIMFCLLGSAQRQQALADPVRSDPSAFGTSGTKASPRARSDGVQRPRLRARGEALVPEVPNAEGSLRTGSASACCL